MSGVAARGPATSDRQAHRFRTSARKKWDHMASRARELLDRSRVLLDRSRVAAAQFLTAPPKHPGYPAAPAAGPALTEPVAPAGEGVLAEICASVALRDLNLLDQLLARLEE